MNKTITFLLIISYQLSIINCYSQDNFHFVKKYGGVSPFIDIGNGILMNNGMNFYSLSQHCTDCNESPNDVVFTIKKFDINGNLIDSGGFQDTIPSSRTYYQNMYIQNNRINVVGTLEDYNYTGVVSRGVIHTFDDDLNYMGHKLIGDTIEWINQVNYVLPINDTKLLYAGYLNDSITPDHPRPIISKIDTSNTPIWTNQYPDFFMGSYSWNIPLKIIRDVDSNFISLIRYRTGGGFGDTEYAKSWLKKFDADGNEIWDYKIIDSSYVTSGIIGNDNKIIIGGSKNLGSDLDWQSGGVGPLGNAPYVAKFNPATNNVEWIYKFTFGFVTGSDKPRTIDVVSAHGSGYVALVNVQDTPVVFINRPMSVLIKLDENGNELWRKRFAAPNDSTIYNDTLVVSEMPLTLNALTTTPDGGYLMVGGISNFANYADVIIIKTNCNGDTASPKAAMNVIVDAATPNLMQVYNLSQYYDTCTFVFSDNSPNINLTMYDTVQTFTHAFAPGTTVTCIAKACNQEWDTVVTAQIITDAVTNKGYYGNKMSLAPNPATNNTNINYCTNSKTETYHIVLYDISGNTVYTDETNGGKYTLNTKNISNGIYYIMLLNNKGIFAKEKLVVQH